MRSLALSLALVVPFVPAGAATGRVLIVGSNQAGPGQTPLRWAEADAERMRAVWVELGGFQPDEVELLHDPDADTLLAAIDRAASALADADDPDSRFVFYYSGHARARTLSLGADELPVDVLDARLDTVPARQRLAVLDACQAGEATAPKGIVAEAAFSFVSVAGLSTTGTAVIASSTASELSQESERLGGSMFTHHWVSALRGAADVDRDGFVTLDEAYGYAYDRTLVDTAATAIGPQHPTLRMDLRGHGDWVLTRPTPASGSLVLPVPLEGAVTVIHGGEVVAEVAKLAIDEVALPVVPGDYEVVVRIDDATCTRRLVITAGETVEVDVSACALAEVADGTPKTTPAPTVRTADFGYQVGLTARGGTSYYQPRSFVTGGGEAAFTLSRQIVLVAGAEVYMNKVVLPPEEQLETGVYSVWRTMVPTNLGFLYKPSWGRVQPYGGLDVITAVTTLEPDSRLRAWGGRVRAGVDVLAVENFGMNLNLAFGAWASPKGDPAEPWTTRSGLLPQASAGVFLAL